MKDFPGLRLCYVRLGVADLESASRFFVDVLGLEAITGDSRQANFRSDARYASLSVIRGGTPSIGIELDDDESLDLVAARIAGGGFVAREANEAECAQRFVRRALLASDAAGNAIDFVVRPAVAARPFYPSVDAGICGLHAVALRSRDIVRDVRFWSGILGVRTSDWVGDITYMRLEGGHHQLALYPSDRDGILYHAYAVDGLDAIMRNKYFLEGRAVNIVHGPGRETVSEETFVRFGGPGDTLCA
ncbi:MAG: VOC family protein, partial [Candidatus Eremiobacteraeota bacterium]|nr:VOC family protein [Candidatus Eremiobacteraeota bacterium]